MNIDNHPVWITRYSENGLWATLYSPKLKKSWVHAIDIMDDAIDVEMTKGADWKQIPRGLHAMLLVIKNAYTMAELNYTMPTNSFRRWSPQQIIDQLQDILDNVQNLLGKHVSPKNSAHEQQQKMLNGRPLKARQHLEHWATVLQDIRDLYVTSKQISNDVEKASHTEFSYNPTLDRMLMVVRENTGNIGNTMKEFANLVREKSFKQDYAALRNLSECAWMVDIVNEYFPDGGQRAVQYLRDATQFGKPVTMGLRAVKLMFQELDSKHDYKFDIFHDSCMFYMYLAMNHGKIGQQLTRADILQMKWAPPQDDPGNSIDMPQIVFVRNTGNKMAHFDRAVPGYNPGHDRSDKSSYPSINSKGKMDAMISAKMKQEMEDDEFDINHLLKSMRKSEEKAAREGVKSPFGYAIAIKIVNQMSDDDDMRIRAMRIPVDTEPQDLLRLSDTVYLLCMQSPRWARKLRVWSGKASFSPFIRISEQDLKDIATQASGFIVLQDIPSNTESMQDIKFQTRGSKKWLRTMLGDRGLKIFTDAAIHKPITAFNL